MLTLLVKGGKCKLISHFPHQIGKYLNVSASSVGRSSHTWLVTILETNLARSIKISGTSLVIQWLGLCVPNARDLGFILGQGTRSHT